MEGHLGPAFLLQWENNNLVMTVTALDHLRRTFTHISTAYMYFSIDR